MIDRSIAYRKLKELADTDLPITAMFDEPKCFSSHVFRNGKMGQVDKESGEVLFVDPPKWNFWFDDICFKYIYVPELYDDILQHYEKNKSEKLLAELYSKAYNNKYYYQEEKEENNRILEFYKSVEDYNLIMQRWSEIERVLYKEIREIMDNDKEIVYPPCVLNKWDDPFYRIKPFMVRNGFSDDRTRKTWVKERR